MSKPIESDALDRVYRMLGLSGGLPRGTLLDDGNVSQVLNLNDIIRRSRTQAGNTGWFKCVMQNVHTGAGALTSTIDPYNPGDAAVAPFEAVAPRGFDFWILMAMLRRTTGAGTLDDAALSMNPGAGQVGWAVDSSDNLAGNFAAHYPLVQWTALQAVAGQSYGLVGEGGYISHVGLRVPRGMGADSLQFRSDAAGAAATFQCSLICGLFVEGLGQDVAQ